MQRSASIDAFLAASGYAGAGRRAIAGDASFRRYERIFLGDKTAVLMDAPPEKEDTRPFVKVAEFLTAQGYSAPRILAADVRQGFLLLEDLGDDLFARVLAADAKDEETLYRAATDVLVDIYRQSASGKRPPLKPYEATPLMQNHMLFVQWYLPEIIGAAEASALVDDYKALWDALLAQVPKLRPVPVLCDFHAENLLWLPQREGLRRVGLLDFQDAAIGSPAYDVVSFLEDARRDVPPALMQAMLDYYIRETGIDREDFLLATALLGAQRNIRILGTFVRLSKRDGKPHYLAFLPRVWGHLHRDLAHPALAPLKQWVERHVPERWHTGAMPERMTAPFPQSAMILAAGLGTRMRPLTDRMPKPLVEVAGRTLLDRALDRLEEAGVKQAVINVSYKAEMIEAHVARRRSPGIIFSREESPLETGGGIAQALGHLGSGPFFSLNADVVVLSGETHFLQRLWQRWDDAAMDALLLLHPVARAVGYDGQGDFFLRDDGRLERDREREQAPYVFTGVQLLHPRLFSAIPPGAFSMNLLYERLMRAGRLYGIVHTGRWLHVGDVAGLKAAEAALGGP